MIGFYWEKGGPGGEVMCCFIFVFLFLASNRLLNFPILFSVPIASWFPKEPLPSSLPRLPQIPAFTILPPQSQQASLSPFPVVRALKYQL